MVMVAIFPTRVALFGLVSIIYGWGNDGLSHLQWLSGLDQLLVASHSTGC